MRRRGVGSSNAPARRGVRRPTVVHPARTGTPAAIPDQRPGLSPSPILTLQPPSPARTAPQGRPDIAIRKVRFIGAGVPANVAKAAERYIGRPASTENLKRLAAAMTRAYNRSSVALFTLVIPEPGFCGRRRHRRLGRGAYKPRDDQRRCAGRPRPADRAHGRTAAWIKAIARAPRFERALGTIADIPGTKVTPTLALGDSPGAVALDLAVDASRPTLGVGFTTRSSPYVRDGIVEATRARLQPPAQRRRESARRRGGGRFQIGCSISPRAIPRRWAPRARAPSCRSRRCAPGRVRSPSTARRGAAGWRSPIR